MAISRGQRDEFRPRRAMGMPKGPGVSAMVRMMKVRAIPAKQLKGSMRGGIGIALEFPPRAALGIDPKDPHYWPAALEYGHAFPGRAGTMKGVPGEMREVPARPFIRNTVDANKRREWDAIGKGIGSDIEAEWRKGQKK